jgi:hypothetical protein
MKKSAFTTLSLIICFTLAAGSAGWADTIKFYEGSVMVGKILSEEKAFIILANAYGTFKIKRIKIDDIYKTNSYQEDITLHKKYKFTLNEDEIKRNYTAGQDRKDGKKVKIIKPKKDMPEEDTDTAEPIQIDKTENKSAEKVEDKSKKKAENKAVEPNKETATGDDHWKSGRFSFSGVFMYNLGSGSSALPYGYGGYVAFDQGLDFAAGDRHPMIPGLRFEGGFLYFKRSSYTMTGFLAAGGLMWAFPSMKNSWGCITLALMPGASFMNTKLSSSYFGGGGSSGYNAINFAGQAILGYQKSWGVFSLFVQARGLYIMAKGADYFSVGGELGFGFNAW